jgi:hypothetical protein
MTNGNTSTLTLYEGGRVIKLVTDDELILNLGKDHGVEPNMVFQVSDPKTEHVIDPKTGEDLGSIKRIKARVRIINVSQRISLARVSPLRGREGISYSVDLIMGEKPLSAKLTGDTWPDGVSIDDPVEYTGTKSKS